MRAYMFGEENLAEIAKNWEKLDAMDEAGNAPPPKKPDPRSPEVGRSNAAAVRGLMGGPSQRTSRRKRARGRRR